MGRRDIGKILNTILEVCKKFGYCDAGKLAATLGISLSTAYNYLREAREFIEVRGIETAYFWDEDKRAFVLKKEFKEGEEK